MCPIDFFAAIYFASLYVAFCDRYSKISLEGVSGTKVTGVVPNTAKHTEIKA